MKIKTVLIGLTLTAAAPSARADVSAWTGREKPEIFSTFKYPYKLAVEVEVSRRLLSNLVNDLDLTQIERGDFKVDLTDHADTYLNRKSLEHVRETNPELAARLTRGLRLDQSVAQQILLNAENAQAKILQHFQAGLLPGAGGSTDAPSSPIPKVGLLAAGDQGLHKQVLAQTDPTRAKLLQQFDATQGSPVPKVGLPGFKAFDFGAPSIIMDKAKILGLNGAPAPTTADLAAAVESDWKRLHERWNELSPEEKRSVMRFSDLAADKKADIVVALTRHQKSTEYVNPSQLLDVTTHGAAYLRPFVAERDGVYQRKVDDKWITDFSDSGSTNSEEFKHREPVTSAREYLDQLEAFTRAVGNFNWIRDPQAASQRDSTYHWNFSVEGRREHVGPLLKAWQNLILIKHLEAGITNVVGIYGYSVDDDAKGMVRLKGRDFVEVRDHFANPEFELALFMSAVQVRNSEGIRLIYDHMPEITPAMLRAVRDSKQLDWQGESISVGEGPFLHLAFGSPGLKVNVTREMFSERSVLDEAEAFYKHSLSDPQVLHDPRRVIQFLGPEGATALKILIKRNLPVTVFDQNVMVTRAHHRFMRVYREERLLAMGSRWITGAVEKWQAVRAAIDWRIARQAEKINVICEDLLLSAALRRNNTPPR